MGGKNLHKSIGKQVSILHQSVHLSAFKSCTNFILYFSISASVKHLNFLQILMNATLKYPSEVSWGC